MSAYDQRPLWSAFASAARPLVERFGDAHRDPADVQRRRLAEIVVAARETAFGRHHDFASIRDPADYAARVPVRDWAGTAPWIERTCAEGAGITSPERPLFVEPTSGSGAPRKPIPYTPALVAEFQRAILVWLASLHGACPAVAAGRSYWALSPPGEPAGTTAGGIPIGGGGDAGYLAGSIALPLLAGVLGPPAMPEVGDDWRLATLAAMIDAEDLSLISVWSPTFLLALLEPLAATDTAGGGHRIDALRATIGPSRRTALERALRTGDCSSLWPRLAVISCWCDGPSERYATALEVRFPGVAMVPKGLLATEGVVSLSWGTRTRCPLALDSHFLEFVGTDGAIVLADALVRGERYRPLLTTGGGLYRYALGDVVEVVEPVDGMTSVRYVGRADARSDLVGEKLDEALVEVALARVAGTSVLVPDAEAMPARYVLVVGEGGPLDAAGQAAQVERALQRVHHYARARRLGQLGPVEGRGVSDLATLRQHAWESVGGSAGDCKPTALIASSSLAGAILRRIEADGSTMR